MSSSGLEGLYQTVILEHSRDKHGYGLQDGAAAASHQVNPTCGDEIDLQLHLASGSDVVTAVHWEGSGCAISQASASLFSDMAAGLTLDELTERIAVFRTALRSRGTIELDEELVGDAVVLGGVSRYIARVKCAMLGWVAAEHAIQQIKAA